MRLLNVRKFKLVNLSGLQAMLAMSTHERLVHVRRESGSDRFQVNFKFVSEKLKAKKTFNFNRNVEEAVEVFLTRFKSSIGKSEEKKAKKTGVRVDIDVRLLRGGQDVGPEEKCVDVFFAQEVKDLKLYVGEDEYEIAVNLPWVMQLVMPKTIVYHSPLFPKTLKIFNGDIDNSDIRWLSSSDNGNNWKVAGSSIIHYPEKDGTTHYKMTCRPGNGKEFGPEVESEVSKSVQLVTTFNRPYDNFSNSKEFRVLSYNMLAELYSETEAAKTQLFAHCPPYALSMDYRKPLLLREILGYKADIVCLQEVDIRFFESELTFLFGRNNYVGFMDEKHETAEGVALFFHKEKFRLVDKLRFVYGNEMKSNSLFKDLHNALKNSPKLLEKINNLGTVLQLVILESVHNPGHYVVVGNTHLYYHPTSDNIRLLQSAMAVKIFQETIKTYENKGKVSMIFCGDFNSTPDSGVYQFMTQKFIPSNYKEWNSGIIVNMQDFINLFLVKEEVTQLELRHDLDIKSAYKVNLSSTFTNFTPLFSGCLDYIYFTDKHISVSETLELPSEEFLKQQVGLPNPNFPSDHLAICSTFKLLS